MSPKYDVPAVQLAAVLALIALLHVAATIYPLLPAPAAIGAALAGLLALEPFYSMLGVTLYEAFAGLAIAAVLGVSIGIAVGANRAVNEFLTPIIVALYSVPKIVFLPVLLMIFGTGAPPKIANAAIHAVFPIILNSLVGMREVNELHKKTARSMLASPMQVVTRVYLPSMVLPVIAGVRLGIGLAFLGALLAELFESTVGVGHGVMDFYNEGRLAEMFAVILAMFCLILVLNAAMKSLENRLSRWRNP